MKRLLYFFRKHVFNWFLILLHVLFLFYTVRAYIIRTIVRFFLIASQKNLKVEWAKFIHLESSLAERN